MDPTFKLDPEQVRLMAFSKQLKADKDGKIKARFLKFARTMYNLGGELIATNAVRANFEPKAIRDDLWKELPDIYLAKWLESISLEDKKKWFDEGIVIANNKSNGTLNEKEE